MRLKFLSLFLIFFIGLPMISASWFSPNAPPPTVLNNNTNISINQITANYYCDSYGCYNLSNNNITNNINLTYNITNNYLNGTCPDGQALQNITMGVFQCINVSNSSGTTYTAGSNITIAGNIISWNSSWVDTLFLKIADLASYLANYYTKNETDSTFIKNNTFNNYVVKSNNLTMTNISMFNENGAIVVGFI